LFSQSSSEGQGGLSGKISQGNNLFAPILYNNAPPNLFNQTTNNLFMQQTSQPSLFSGSLFSQQQTKTAPNADEEDLN
jgi:hypothetical protein